MAVTITENSEDEQACASLEKMFLVLKGEEDQKLHLGNKNCDLMKQMMDEAKKSEHQAYIDEFNTYLTINYL